MYELQNIGTSGEFLWLILLIHALVMKSSHACRQLSPIDHIPELFSTGINSFVRRSRRIALSDTNRIILQPLRRATTIVQTSSRDFASDECLL